MSASGHGITSAAGFFLGLGALLATGASGEPARAQSPLVVGCADGTREGFTSLATYPNIASCGGAWTVKGAFHDDASCGRLAGNDGVNETGTGCNVEDLCAGGWHVCYGPDDIDVRTGGKGCADAVASNYPNNGTGSFSPGGAFFMTRTSGSGVGLCDEVVNGFPQSFNDIFGCGNMGGMPTTTCAPLNRFGNNQCAGLQNATSYSGTPATAFGYDSSKWAWTCNDGGNGTFESQHVLKTRPDDQGGVLCCKDTDGSLPEICDYRDNDADRLIDETDFFGDGSADDFPGDPCTQANGQPGTIACTNAGGWICGPIAPVGCCFEDGRCRDLAPDTCTSNDGRHGGAGSRCANMVCEVDPCWDGDGSPCDDGEVCTTDDRCLGGICGGVPLTCDDGNACTDDRCQVGLGCVSVNNTAACDDLNACTAGDVCQGGVCRGAAISCDDGNPCTNDRCLATGCDHQNNAALCDDGSVCTTGDACQGGVCVGRAVSCDDGNPCTDDACGPGGCTHVDNAAPCNDGDPCTGGDVCGGGVCGGAALSCDDGNPCTIDSCGADGCRHQATSGGCDDGDPCTSSETCQAGVCKGVPISCDDDNPCTDDSCGRGGCAHAANAAACDDGDACTSGEACAGGVCGGGAPVSCDDGNPCTDDSCGASGCEHRDNSASCDDGDVCTTGDTCGGGVCGGAPVRCDDGNPCTDDSCGPGGCVSSDNAASCEDGDACTGGDRCAGGVCVPGTVDVCACVEGDADADAICDEVDECIDVDQDGYGEGDGCPPDCNDEVATCTTDCVSDFDGGDGNGIPDCEEAQCVDGDGDGYGVGAGCAGADCDDASPRCARDCTDGDGDGAPNCRDDDDDDDGLNDELEVSAGTNPDNADSDGDGVLDGDEVLVHDTDPKSGDSDGDGVSDGVEIAQGSDPIDASDGGVPGDGRGAESAASDEGCAGGSSVVGLGVLGALVGLRARRRRTRREG